MKKYIVKQSIDTLDTNPTVSEPVEHWEAEELEEIRENETALVKIEEV